jgi:hypothetical protein
MQIRGLNDWRIALALGAFGTVIVTLLFQSIAAGPTIGIAKHVYPSGEAIAQSSAIPPGTGDVAAAAESPPPSNNRSGLPWMSGVNGDPLIDAASVEAFGAWRGRPTDVALVYTDRSTWDTMTKPGWLYSNFAGWPGKLVISQAPFPSGGNYKACAAGQYDGHMRTFGETLVSTGWGNSIVRLAWEFNGTYMYWGASNTTDFINCWRREVDALRSTAPNVLIDWTINAHSTPKSVCGGSARNCYPGDAWVDVIGIDAYDHYPPSFNQAQWNSMCNGREGPCGLIEFARQHGKRFSVGEWGVNHANPVNGGGDNKFFIDSMWAFFQANAATLLYEAYYNNCEPDNVMSDIYRGCGGNPLAAAAYLSHY